MIYRQYKTRRHVPAGGHHAPPPPLDEMSLYSASGGTQHQWSKWLPVL